MIRLARRSIAVAAVAAVLVAVAPSASHAGPKTLARSAQNLLFFPFDIALSPFVAGKATWEHWRDSDDSTAVKWGYLPFAPIWNFSIEAGASVIRGVAGMLELLPGIALLPFEAEMNPLYDLPESQPAWVDQGGDAFKVRFGVDYLTATN